MLSLDAVFLKIFFWHNYSNNLTTFYQRSKRFVRYNLQHYYQTLSLNNSYKNNIQ